MSSITLEKEAINQAALYALGALNQHEKHVFESALVADTSLAAEVQAFDAVVASLALGVLEAQPPARLRKKLLDRIATLEQEPQRRTAQPVNPDPATISIRLAEGKWHTLAPKVSCKVLHTDSQTGLVTSLIKLEPGGCLPSHRHLGIEQTLVVEGDCRVNGEIFYPGDFRMRPADTEDTEVTTAHGTIILLIAPERCEVLDPSWPN
jgi:anti-sigma factor ChrR (cupin superfamily)